MNGGVYLVRNAIGYIRVSTEEQGSDDKYGIDTQKQAIQTSQTYVYTNTHAPLSNHINPHANLTSKSNSCHLDARTRSSPF